MDATQRRKAIVELIESAGGSKPLSATAISKTLGVSRQVIVGDVALLRASGYDILATARGYLLPPQPDSNHYVGTIACKHTPEQTEQELMLLVEQGAVVNNVIVAHEVYGEITGQLALQTPADVRAFIAQLTRSGAGLLSQLTAGIHLHTITCRDETHFEQVRQTLDKHGFLLTDVNMDS